MSRSVQIKRTDRLTPGHTPGSTSFLVPGAGAATYLLVGDTAYRPAGGTGPPATSRE